ncbi:S9 family peptidase [Paenibacillus sp. S-12]|uniref:alpha/beta hydrolase family protein n=1 Tax=Paenibacillus sp. S-12 TaxID=3031371 RepID=UPI0025A26CC3|nr:S9 family peptidase [Paenibacillus sp. S-12]
MERRVITAKDLYRFVWLSDPAVNPVDGTIAYVAKQVNEEKSGYRSRIHITTADGTKSKVFTHGEQDNAPIWSPDGQKLAFLRKKGKYQQIWLMAADGGEAEALTDTEFGVSAFLWSPDGSRLLYTTSTNQAEIEKVNAQGDCENKPGKQAIVVDRLKCKADGKGLLDSKRSHLHVLDLQSGSTVPLTSGDYDIHDFAWSPDGVHAAFSANRIEEDRVDQDLVFTQDIYIVNCKDGVCRRVTNSGLVIGNIAFSPDGQTIAFLGHNRQYENATLILLYTVPVTGGTAECMHPDLDLYLDNAAVTDMKALGSSAPVFTPDGSSIYSLVSAEGSVQLARFSLNGDYEILSSGDREITQFTVAQDGKQIVFISADPLQPGNLCTMDMSTGREQRLVAPNDSFLAELNLSQPESFWFQTSDGWKVQAWIMKPPGMSAGDKVPTIVEIHGGPHTMYAHSFMHEFQLLAAQGYAVLYSNPRGSHGYGQKFVDACRGDYGGKDYEDIMETLDQAIARYDFIDKDRLGVTGGSYGGFMTNWVVGHTNRFKGAVTQRSISNWFSFYGVSDIGYFFTEDQICAQPWEDPEKLWKHSPLAYVDKVQTPLLILHGEQDLRCPIEQAEQLYVALKRLGKTTQLVRFPDANHDLSRNGHPELRVERLNRIVGWMKQYV